MSPDHVGWCKASAWALGEVLAGLPRPMSRAAMVLDLDFMVDRRKMTGEPVPGVRLLSRRWGVGVKAARLAVEAWRRDSLVGRAEVEGHGEGHAQGHGEGHGEGHALTATMPMVSASLAQEGHAQGHGEGHAQGHSEGTPVVQEVLFTGIVEAPQTTDIQTSDKNTNKPAKAGAVDLQALLDEMHAMELAVRPTAQAPRLSTYEKSIRRTLEGLKDRAREEASTPRALMMAAWTWWWTNPEGWHRTALHGARGYRAFFQHAHVKHYLDRMRDEAATAPASPAAAPPKPKSPGEVAWDRWMEGLDAARAWYAANKGTREGDAFHAAMEAACKPNPIAELFGGYMDNPKERRIVREVFVSEYERRTTPLRLVAR